MKKLLASASILIFLSSCVNDAVEPPPTSEIECSTETQSSTTEVPIQIVELLADNYCGTKEQAASRSKNAQHRVTTLYDGEKPRVHIINYEDGGYTVMSATKAINPVLAHSDKGHFDTANIPTPINDWLQGVYDVAAERESLPEDSLFRTIDNWNDLIAKYSEPTYYPMGDYSEEPFATGRKQIMDKFYEVYGAGHRIYMHGEQFCEDEQLCNDVWQRAKGSVYPVYEDYWYDFCFVAKITEEETDNRYYDVPTMWGQEFGFNLNFPLNADGTRPPAGCAPVAMAQLMYYFSFPTSYNWGSMDLQWDSPESRRLIYDVAKSAKTIDGGTYIENIAPAFNSFGYDCSIITEQSYLWEIVKGLIKEKQMPLMVGGDNITASDKRHMWLACGYKDITIKDGFILYYIASPYQGKPFEEDYAMQYTRTEDKIYFNWGFYGQYNGYFSTASPKEGQEYKLNCIITAKPK